MNIFHIIALSVALSTTSVVATEAPTGQTCTITKVSDGDTFHANCSGKDVKVRMTIIDSYESKKNNRAFRQAYEQRMSIEQVVNRGKTAKDVATKLMLNKEVVIVPNPKQPKDQYGRTLGKVYLNGTELNDKLLTEYPNLYLRYK